MDHLGEQLQAPLDTAFASSREAQHLIFGDTGLIELEEPLEYLEQQPGVAIFFEFKHFKTKGDGYVSTKCYSFMELDELKNGEVTLEILKCEKPTDFARIGTPTRLSVKPLYLHIMCEITTHY